MVGARLSSVGESDSQTEGKTKGLETVRLS